MGNANNKISGNAIKLYKKRYVIFWFIGLILLFSFIYLNTFDPIDPPPNSYIPKFPWPPPKASAVEVIPNSVFSKCNTYFDVDEILDLALNKNGYYDKSYYAIVPNDSILGFAIATKLEQINKDATSKQPPNRWKTKVEMNDFSFSEYISSLFFTQTGYFRVIVFIVTAESFKMTNKSVERKVALSWVHEGNHIMPPELRKMPFTDDYSVTALIYEYELPEHSEKAQLNRPSEHSGREHLEKSKLWGTLIHE